MSIRPWPLVRWLRTIRAHVRARRTHARRTAFYRQFIARADLVFDVGAHLGSHSTLFRSLGARVVAFEPGTHCAHQLATTFAEDTQFTLIHAGASDAEGEAILHLGASTQLATVDVEWMTRMNTGGRFAGQWDHTEVIRLTTLDVVIEQHGVPTFAKIDVEGHEYHVVRGLSRPLNALSLEFASESVDTIVRCLEHLQSLAPYEYRLVWGDSLKFATPDWRDLEDIRQQLDQAVGRDRLVWGDVYARRVTTS
jgi:FkbM family methyltransferase